MPSPPFSHIHGTANSSGAFASLYAAVAELQEMSGKCEECNADGLPFCLNPLANGRNSCVRCLLKTWQKVGFLWRENYQLRSMNDGMRKRLPMSQGYGDGATWSSAPPQFQFGASSSSSAHIHGTANGSGAFASLYAAIAELQEMSGKCEECNADGFLNPQANARNICVRCLLKTCEKVGSLWRENNQLRSMNDGLRKQFAMLQGYGDGATWSSAPPQFQFGASSSSSAHVHGTQVHRGLHPDYKTKICEKWVLGTCSFGLHCNFAHGNEELRPAIRYCWGFLREGVCKLGESCPYLHTKPPSEFLEYE